MCTILIQVRLLILTPKYSKANKRRDRILYSISEFQRTSQVYVCKLNWFLDTSVDIDTEIAQSEQGTVSIETTFCINAT